MVGNAEGEGDDEKQCEMLLQAVGDSDTVAQGVALLQSVGEGEPVAQDDALPQTVVVPLPPEVLGEAPADGEEAIEAEGPLLAELLDVGEVETLRHSVGEGEGVAQGEAEAQLLYEGEALLTPVRVPHAEGVLQPLLLKETLTLREPPPPPDEGDMEAEEQGEELAVEQGVALSEAVPQDERLPLSEGVTELVPHGEALMLLEVLLVPQTEAVGEGVAQLLADSVKDTLEVVEPLAVGVTAPFDAVCDALMQPLGDKVLLAVPEAQKVALSVGDTDEEAVSVPLPQELTEALDVPQPLKEPVAERDGDSVPLLHCERLLVCESVTVAQPVELPDSEPLSVPLPQALALALTQAVVDPVAQLLLDAEAVPHVDGVVLPLADALPQAHGVPVGEGVAQTLTVGEAVALLLAQYVLLPVPQDVGLLEVHCDRLADALAVDVGQAVPLSEGVALSVAQPLPEPDPVPVAAKDGEELLVGDTVEDADTHVVDDAVQQLEVVALTVLLRLEVALLE